ncbi:DGQHR domain-containing protein [Lacrimispora amygdalina]|uniref:DGQHR domain-containing protein n=1 Tax=Lacrimispora amygdalina TaxID=253257 RepID=A0ABQ5M5G4_9FIRM
MAKYINRNDYITAKFGNVNAYIFTACVKEILPIYYVAVRGRDNEEGAVQRVLNKRRISSIADFVLDGNMFFNPFILNWVDENYPLEFNDNGIKVPLIRDGAQVIDGQHRLEGLRVAYEVNKNIGEKEIIIIMTERLTTKDAAQIFLNINSEQKPVPKSLVYDLFGEVKDKDYHIVRATDIANMLHDDKNSPYYQCIKLPGAKQGSLKVDLSTVVNVLKGYTISDGLFKQYNLGDLESQYKVIFNFCSVIKEYYEDDGEWLKNVNPFMTNAGFYSMIQFLCEDILPKCVEKKSFEKKVIKALLPLNEIGLLYREDIKNIQGKEQRAEVYKYLKSALLREIPNQNEYKF